MSLLVENVTKRFSNVVAAKLQHGDTPGQHVGRLTKRRQDYHGPGGPGRHQGG